MNMISDLVLAMVARTTCRGARLAELPFCSGWVAAVARHR